MWRNPQQLCLWSRRGFASPQSALSSVSCFRYCIELSMYTVSEKFRYARWLSITFKKPQLIRMSVTDNIFFSAYCRLLACCQLLLASKWWWWWCRFLIGFFVRLCYNVLRFLFFLFHFLCVYGCVHDKLAQYIYIHIVTICDQLDELCSFSGSLPHVYLY